MTAGPQTVAGLAHARRVADAVLYEGYLLFPYRASARKNRMRWQFGVIVPRRQHEAGTSEPWRCRTEVVVVDAGADSAVEVVVRALVATPGSGEPAWDEGVEVEPFHRRMSLSLARQPVTAPFTVRPRADEPSPAVTGSVTVDAVELAVDDTAGDDRPRTAFRLGVTVENTTPWADAEAGRDTILRRSLIGVHVIAATSEGAFVSSIDPPTWAAAHVEACTNDGLYPVLAGPPGDHQVVLAAPIILYDHPEVAPESTGDLCDATEIDELLSLMVKALPEEEKEEARRTDPRAAEIVDRIDSMPPEVFERLHGAIRSLGPATPGAGAEAHGGPSADRLAGLDAELAEFFGIDDDPIERAVVLGGEVALGDLVRVEPRRRADAQDLFAAGRTARVGRILADVDGSTHVGVLLVDDPGSDLHDWYGRYLWFQPDELRRVPSDDETTASDRRTDRDPGAHRPDEQLSEEDASWTSRS